MSPEARGEMERVLKLWGDARVSTVKRLKELGKEGEDEGFLFGKFGIADAFYWPVLWVRIFFSPPKRCNEINLGFLLYSASDRTASPSTTRPQRPSRG